MTIKNALEKLDEGAKEKITDKYGAVIKTYVHSTLAGFCKQNESFAQAVLDGGTFAECVKYCTEGISGNTGISDIDVYRRAAQFYFPGAQVDFKIQIIMNGTETLIHEEPQRKVKSKTEEVKMKTEEVKSEPPTTEIETKTTEIEQKTAEMKRKNTKSERKTQKSDSNIIQLDLFA